LVQLYYNEELKRLMAKPWWNSAEKELTSWLKIKALERAHKQTKKELKIDDY
jgi:hypothetical protein